MPETPNHGYNVPNAGDQDWHIPLNENFEDYDTDIEIRDTRSNRSNYTPKAGAKFVATDTEAVFIGDGSNWNRFQSSGTSPRLSGLSVGGTGRGLTHFASGDEYAVVATAAPQSLGSAILATNDGSAGDALQATTSEGRSAVWARGEDNADYAIRARGGISMAPASPANAPTRFEVAESGTITFDTAVDESRREPMMYMYAEGTQNALQPVVVHSEQFSDWGLFYRDENDKFQFRANDNVSIRIDPRTGDIDSIGNKNFVQSVETDDGEREVVYTASEAGTPHTEVSGVAELEDGRAEIDLPDHFQWVTDADEPVVVQTTPYGGESGMKVVERSPERIVVEDLQGTESYEFAYTVKGTRIGQADKQVVRDPTADASATGAGEAPADD